MPNVIKKNYLTSKQLFEEVIGFYERKKRIKDVKLGFSSCKLNSDNLIDISFYPEYSTDPFDIIFVTVHWEDKNGNVKSNEERTIESWNMDVAFRRFDPDELKLFDGLGFRISDEAFVATKQEVEEWYEFS